MPIQIRTLLAMCLPGLLMGCSLLPDTRTLLDPGPEEPEAPTTFCAAVASMPLRWTTDALLPMQLWVDTFEAVSDAPPPAAMAIERLLGFTRSRLRWSLTGQGERPDWDARTQAAGLVLVDAAISSCPDLPLAIGWPGTSDRPRGWDGLDEREIRVRCDGVAQRVEAAITDYEATIGRPPRHQMEMELQLPYFYASDFHGVGLDEEAETVVVAVPGGACDPAAS